MSTVEKYEGHATSHDYKPRNGAGGKNGEAGQTTRENMTRGEVSWALTRRINPPTSASASSTASCHLECTRSLGRSNFQGCRQQACTGSSRGGGGGEREVKRDRGEFGHNALDGEIH